MKIQIIGGKVIRQNIAGWCQQTFCFQKFFDNSQQCFASTAQANFPAHNLNFHLRWMWWNGIQAIFLNLFYFNIGGFWLPSVPHPLPRRHSLWTAPYIYYVKWSVAWWWLVKSFMLERSVILWSFIENLCASAWLMPYIYTLCPFLGFTFQNNSFLSEMSS